MPQCLDWVMHVKYPAISDVKKTAPAMLLDELYELVCGCDHGDASANDLLADVQIDLARCAADVSKVCTQQQPPQYSSMCTTQKQGPRELICLTSASSQTDV